MKYDITKFIPISEIDPDDINGVTEASDPSVLFLASYIFEGGFGMAQIDVEFAAEIAKYGADQGDPLLQVRYGILLVNQMLKDRDVGTGHRYVHKGIEGLKALAEAGSPYAQTLLGVLYSNGIHVEKNYQTARTLWESASAQGEPATLLSLALMYRDGNGVPRDAEKFLELLTASALSDYTIAQEFLAREHARRDNFEEAIKYARRALQQGSDITPKDIADYYHNAGDYRHAFKWYLRAAKREQPAAMERVVNYCMKKLSPSESCSSAMAFQFCAIIINDRATPKDNRLLREKQARILKISAQKVDSEGNPRTKDTPEDDKWLLFIDGSMARDAIRPSKGKKSPRQAKKAAR